MRGDITDFCDRRFIDAGADRKYREPLGMQHIGQCSELAGWPAFYWVLRGAAGDDQREFIGKREAFQRIIEPGKIGRARAWDAE